MTGEEKPHRGDVDNYKVDKEKTYPLKDAKLCGELWDIEHKRLTVGDYANTIEGTRDPVKRKIAVAQAIVVTMNGKSPDWDNMDAQLGLELAQHIDLALEVRPTKK